VHVSVPNQLAHLNDALTSGWSRKAVRSPEKLEPGTQDGIERDPNFKRVKDAGVEVQASQLHDGIHSGSVCGESARGRAGARIDEVAITDNRPSIHRTIVIKLCQSDCAAAVQHDIVEVEGFHCSSSAAQGAKSQK
jgi:hypothetical protein